MAEAFERLLIGRTLAGRYAIEEVLGRGGMSVVYAGVDRTLGRPVAIKIVRMPTAEEDQRVELRERFRREAANAARIPPHANVVQIYDYGTDAELDLDFIIMELLRGEDLKQLLQRGSPPRREALRILRQAARGLAAGHRVGIVHRDVKPANVFLSGEGELESVRILDFGIAKPMETGADADTALTRTGYLPHSPAYASPEQLRPAAPVGPPSDVYQLGLIGYEMVAGERPFLPEERERVAAGEAIPLPLRGRWGDADPEFRSVIEQALRPDPAERFADAAAFAQALAGGAALDHTRLHGAPAPAAAPQSDATEIAPPSRAPTAPGLHVAHSLPEHPEVSPDVQAVPRARRGRSRAAWAIPLLLLLGVGVWLARRGGPGSEPAAARAPTDTGEIAALDREFVGLMASADTSAAGGAGAGAVAETEDAGAEAAEVQAEVLDLHQAWAEGDLERYLSHYAETVRFYSRGMLPRSTLRRDRADEMQRFPARQIRVRRQAVTFPQPQRRARVLVNREWVFEGPGDRSVGAGRYELILERRGGRWLVVSERELERLPTPETAG